MTIVDTRAPRRTRLWLPPCLGSQIATVVPAPSPGGNGGGDRTGLGYCDLLRCRRIGAGFVSVLSLATVSACQPWAKTRTWQEGCAVWCRGCSRCVWDRQVLVQPCTRAAPEQDVVVKGPTWPQADVTTENQSPLAEHVGAPPEGARPASWPRVVVCRGGSGSVDLRECAGASEQWEAVGEGGETCPLLRCLSFLHRVTWGPPAPRAYRAPW